MRHITVPSRLFTLSFHEIRERLLDDEFNAAILQVIVKHLPLHVTICTSNECASTSKAACTMISASSSVEENAMQFLSHDP